MMKILPGLYTGSLLIFCLLCSPLPVAATGVADTKHNLSSAGPGTIKALDAFEICVFCHTPHQAAGSTYLWNRYESTATYMPYQSSTLKASVDQPTGASKLCLSCHDGTVALGMLASRPDELAFQWQKPNSDPETIRFMPAGSAGLIGTDLRKSHPISFKYDAALKGKNPELADPASLTHPVHLDKEDEMQCTSCHDPHDNTFGKFLVMSNQYSLLCTHCHNLTSWTDSAHATSTEVWNGQEPAPWPPGSYPTVKENGCACCHVNHGADSARLLRYAVEEDTCLACHNGNVAQKNIALELEKVSVHGVQDYVGVHDPAEDYSSIVTAVEKHVECVDCHNPHRATNTPPPPVLGAVPLVSGTTAGVSGIDIGGFSMPEAQYSYEICFKCHGDSDHNVIAAYPVTRQIGQLNTRLELLPTNPSFHPVAAKRSNPEVPSLIPSLTQDSRMGCIDCHSNNDPTGARGPHGSNNPYLLARTYSMADGTIESPDAYALCYSCHLRDNLLADNSFPHNIHVLSPNNTPCSVCHDPHGISSEPPPNGGNAINNSNLINFDTLIVTAVSPEVPLRFEDQGSHSGRCFLTCHGVVHNTDSVPPEKYSYP